MDRQTFNTQQRNILDAISDITKLIDAIERNVQTVEGVLSRYGNKHSRLVSDLESAISRRKIDPDTLSLYSVIAGLRAELDQLEMDFNRELREHYDEDVLTEKDTWR
jgi:hypothetical protein